MASAPAGPDGQEHLGSGDAEGERHRLGCRLPQPVADLVVEGLGLAGLGDVGVVAQAVEELGTVGLAVDRVQLVVLDELVRLGAVGHRVFGRRPSVPSQTPAIPASGPRLARVSGPPSGSV